MPSPEAQVNALAEEARRLFRANPAESLRLADEASALASSLGADRPLALAGRARGVALWSLARWEEALAAFEEGERRAEAAGDRLLAAQVPILAVETLARLGRHREAIRLADRLHRRFVELDSGQDAAKVRANAGNIHFEREEFLEARACWDEALAWFRHQGQTLAVAQIQVNLANVLTQLHRLPEAVSAYEEARAALEGAGQLAVAAGIEGNLGFLQFMEGRHTDALAAFARARQRFEALGLEQDLAKCDREAAEIYLELNLIPEAREAFERVSAVFRSKAMPAEAARADVGLAATYAAEGRDEEARGALARAEAAFAAEGNQRGAARARLQRAECGLGDEGLPSALAEFKRQGLLIDALRTRVALLFREVEAGRDPIRRLHALVRDARAAGALGILWQAEALVARSSRRQGRMVAARRHYRLAVEAIERARLMLRGDDFRMAYLHDKVRVYEEYLSLLLDSGGTRALREAFRVAEQARSRTLLELVAAPLEQDQGGAGGEVSRLRARLEELRAELRWDYGRIMEEKGPNSRLPAATPALPKQMAEREREYQGVLRQLQLAEPNAATAASPPEPGELQSLLLPGEQLVEFAAAGDELIAFVVGPDRVQTVRAVASRAEVEEEASRLRFQWQRAHAGPGGDDTAWASATGRSLRALYDLVLLPLEGALAAERLTIIPHGVLHGIPFHALHDGSRYGLDRWEIAVAPSAAVWRACRLRPEPTGTGSLAFGVSGQGLEHVDAELGALREQVPGLRIVSDDAATVASVPSSGSFRFLHFATHAVFRADNPLFSGLKMADGWLIAHDLYRRRLECGLATLSACRTGVSRVTPADEVLGLVRGFLHAGAQAALVSLWAADDAATSALMGRFYALMGDGRSRAASLREAQSWLREQFPHPYHWAPFCMVGAR